ncbi:MAG: hypothetical protein HZB38_07915 [Planctomycetes bacterium]|nr:hypothetical protein [Planctomycetota bacterium]
MNASNGRYILLQIHLSDGYTYPWGNTRGSFYGVTGLPTTAQDGILRRVGAYGAGTYQSDYNSRVAVTTPVGLAINPDHQSGGVWSLPVTASLESSASAARTMRINLVQVVDHYPTTETHWRNCFMQAATPQTVTLQPGETRTLNFSMTFSGATWLNLINRREIGVIAWAQNTGTFPSGSEVYQAAQVEWAQLLPSDLNGNGTCDLTDLAVLLSNFGTLSDATQNMGDTDGDGDVDLSDLAALLSDFGT